LKEVQSRYSIYLDNYIKSANIEAETLLMIAKKQILPVVMDWQAKLALELFNIKAISVEAAATHQKMFDMVSEYLAGLEENIEKLRFSKGIAGQTRDIKKQGILFRDQVRVAMAGLREVIDKLEVFMPRELWPFPTYADILFYQ
ncbi:MAG: glutamine synthetase type III, partial [Clostridia bacterium]